jgi:hypothetical protein
VVRIMMCVDDDVVYREDVFQIQGVESVVVTKGFVLYKLSWIVARGRRRFVFSRSKDDV